MPTLDSLTTTLRLRVGDMFSYVSDPTTLLQEFLSNANETLFGLKTLTELTPVEAQAVILLAHIMCCYRSSSDNLLLAEMESPEGRMKMAAVDNALALAEALDARLKDHMNSNGLTDLYKLVSVRVTTSDPLTGRRIPLRYQNITPMVPSSAPSFTTEGGKPVLQWAQSKDPDFTAYHVYHATTSGIHSVAAQMGGYGAPVVSTARQLATILNRQNSAVYLTTLPAGTHYFIVITETGTGVYHVSQEVSTVLI